jgi:hypothetical protein
MLNIMVLLTVDEVDDNYDQDYDEGDGCDDDGYDDNCLGVRVRALRSDQLEPSYRPRQVLLLMMRIVTLSHTFLIKDCPIMPPLFYSQSSIPLSFTHSSTPHHSSLHHSLMYSTSFIPPSFNHLLHIIHPSMIHSHHSPPHSPSTLHLHYE